eukprot:787354-Prorocentrum_minimum.AAC.1
MVAGVFRRVRCSSGARARLASLLTPFCDWCLLRVYSLSPSAIGAVAHARHRKGCDQGGVIRGAGEEYPPDPLVWHWWSVSLPTLSG